MEYQILQNKQNLAINNKIANLTKTFQILNYYVYR